MSGRMVGRLAASGASGLLAALAALVDRRPGASLRFHFGDAAIFIAGLLGMVILALVMGLLLR